MSKLISGSRIAGHSSRSGRASKAVVATVGGSPAAGRAAPMPELAGKRIIVAEDDYLLARDMCRDLREMGATVLGPAPTPFYAMHFIGRRKIDAAVLDIRLHGTTVFEVADLLAADGVPVLFATALDREALPPRFRTMALLEKPFERKQLLQEICAAMRQRCAPRAEAAPSPRPAPAHFFARALASGMAQDGRR